MSQVGSTSDPHNGELRLRPVTLREAREVVQKWHSHHKPHLQQVLAIGGEVDGCLCAVAVLELPKARMLNNGRTWEVSRLCVGPNAPHCAASKLLGASWRAAKAVGCTRLVSYIRFDEKGTCYHAAGWTSVATVPAEDWTRRSKKMYLPGFYDSTKSTETVDRIRWEIKTESLLALAKNSGVK